MSVYLAEARAYARELAEDGFIRSDEDVIVAVLAYLGEHATFTVREAASVVKAYNESAGR